MLKLIASLFAPSQPLPFGQAVNKVDAHDIVINDGVVLGQTGSTCVVEWRNGVTTTEPRKTLVAVEAD